MGVALIDIKKVPTGNKFSIVVFDAVGIHEHIVTGYTNCREKVDVLKKALRQKGYGVEIQNSD